MLITLLIVDLMIAVVILTLMVLGTPWKETVQSSTKPVGSAHVASLIAIAMSAVIGLIVLALIITLMSGVN